MTRPSLFALLVLATAGALALLLGPELHDEGASTFVQDTSDASFCPARDPLLGGDSKPHAGPEAGAIVMPWTTPTAEEPYILDITLDPPNGSLHGEARIRLGAMAQTPTATVLLAPEATIIRLEVGGRDVAYDRRGDVLELAQLPPGEVLVIEYVCVFNDPVEEEPASMDNPGFGVLAHISPKGTMLLAGARWRPVALEPALLEKHVNLTVRAPEGVHAVTTGALVGHSTAEGVTVSQWLAKSPRGVGDTALVAGPYEVRRRQNPDEEVAVLTYFTKERAELSDRYLEASARHVAFYEELHGPYPFAQFAVVENFFPTGYGFPGYTLLGGRVLALPFIPETSLRHEVAHCWWGNGVLVDYLNGNWCEGLATYVADHLAKEEESPAAALEYRLNTLRRFALVVPPTLDFPLTEFSSRTSPATQAIGYGKAMYVFHMLRRRVGDDAFWATLATFYKERLFAEVGWTDFQDAFTGEGLMGEDEAAQFFRQWVAQPGAPRLALEAARKPLGEGWALNATVRREPPGYAVRPALRYMDEAGAITRDVALALGEDAVTVSMQTQAPLLSVTLDPEADVFRRMDPGELPATVNALKGADSLTAVVADALLAKGEARELARWVLASLSQPRGRILSEEEAAALAEQGEGSLAEEALLFFGSPQAPALQPLFDVAAEAAPPAEAAAPDADTRFRVAFPATSSRAASPPPIGAFLLDEDATLETLFAAARKVTHYGKYSHLAFVEGRNVGKSAQPARHDPLTIRFDP